MYVRLNALNMSIWNTEQIRLNELQWLVRSTVYDVQGEYGRNPNHRLIIAG